MGYYSDVRLTVSKEGFDRLSSFVNSTCKEAECLNPLDHCTNLFRGRDFYLISWDDWKWYSQFPEIEVMEDGLKKLKEADCSYDFCRMGEDLDDIEEDSHVSSREGEPDCRYYMPYISREFVDIDVICRNDMVNAKDFQQIDDIEL